MLLFDYSAGGAYVMLSRNLGTKWGGALGAFLYLANTYATVLYLLGGIEILMVSLGILL